MNEAEKKLADELLKDVTLLNASQRLEDYKALLQCALLRRDLEQPTISDVMRHAATGIRAARPGELEVPKPTGHAAIDNA